MANRRMQPWLKVNHQRIREEMAKKAWSSTELAQKARISSAVTTRLNQNKEITMKMIGKIAKAFGVEPQELVTIIPTE